MNKRWSLLSDASIDAISEQYQAEFWREVAFVNARRFRVLTAFTSASYGGLIYVVNVLNSLRLSDADNRLVLMMHIGLLLVNVTIMLLFYSRPLRSPLDITPYFRRLLSATAVLTVLSTLAFSCVIIVTNGHPIFFFIAVVVWCSSLLVPLRLSLVAGGLMVAAMLVILLFLLPTTENPRFVAETFIITLAIPALVIGSSSLLFRSTAENFRQRKMVEEESNEIVRLNRELQQRQQILEEQAVEIEVMNTQLQEQNQSLLELSAEKDEFLGIAAHDLKNPLNGIRGLAEMLYEYGHETSAEENKQTLGSIITSSERMFSLIKNLLDMNALERQGMQLNPVTLDAASITAMIADMHQHRATQKNITLHFSKNAEYVEHAEHAAGNSLIRADEQALTQVLDNLISNAVKYSPQGKSVFVRLKPSTNAVRVEIQDEGPGISSEDMKKLFGKFARLTAQPTGGEHSTGLGLSIVKKLVEAMNGRVWCESELGKGATFVLELPKADARKSL
jgi:signal transduction histidine kinase